MPTLLNRLVRAASLATTLVLMGIVLVLGRDWLKVIGPRRLHLRDLTFRFLEVFLASYFIVLTAAVLAMAVLGWIVWRSRTRSTPVRWLLLCGSIVLGLVLAEAVAAVWLSWLHRLPALPRHFSGSAWPRNEILVVVIGESSALGVPYDGWLSIGMIIGRELQKAIPSRRFRIENLAEKGSTLEAMHQKLACLTEQPDALIIFSGHNEFLARFSMANRVAYYSDDQLFWHPGAWLKRAGRFSPLATLALESLEKNRVSIMPAQTLGAIETVVGRPVCTSNDTNVTVANFHRRLEAIVTDCEQIGCLPILIIPPGNDSSAPNQSCATPWTNVVRRRALAHRLLDILTIEAQDPNQAIAAYRMIVVEQPTHALAHYRLARLLELASTFVEANRHYILARDHDGLPLRCITPLEAAYRAVAQRHPESVVLVDGPAVLKNKSRHGILDADLFHDNVHPTLAGHIALAEAVLHGLRVRNAFGWPASTPAPVLDLRQCADQFGIDAIAWATVCDRSAVFYRQLALLPCDSAERAEWRERYATAAHWIRAGARPEEVGIPGVGVERRDPKDKADARGVRSEIK